MKIINEFYPKHGLNDPFYKTCFLRNIAYEISTLREKIARLESENEKAHQALKQLSSGDEMSEYFDKIIRSIIDGNEYEVSQDFYSWVNNTARSGL